MSKTIVVTSLGSVAGDIVIKKLHAAGHRVVGCDIYPAAWVADSLFVDAFYQVPYASDTENYLTTLTDICQREKADFIFPLTDVDVDLFSARRDWVAEQGVTVCFSPKETLDIARNKKTLAEFIAREVPEVTSIPTLMVRDVEELPWDFPVVCKPHNGRSSQGLRYIHSQEEWEQFRAVADLDVYIVEPYVKGPIVMVEIVRQPETGTIVAMTREELLDTPHSCGLTVRTYREPELEEACKVLAERLGIWGNVNFEFLRDEAGVHHFVECNPRFSAGTEFMCLSGYDLVNNHLRCFMGEEIEPVEDYHWLTIARKYKEYVTGEEEPTC